MSFLRKHWYDIGFMIAVCIVGYALFMHANYYSFPFLMWMNFVTLLIHQFEEYRFPGYFPGMVNVVMYNSEQPDRYPLNTQTALAVNVFMGWVVYLLAALLNVKAVWLGIASVLVSAGNVIAHTLVFNIKGKTIYNPGLFTSLFLFLPLIIYFFIYLTNFHLATVTDYVIGCIAGILLNVIGILKLIDWMKDPSTNYIFEERQVAPQLNK